MDNIIYQITEFSDFTVDIFNVGVGGFIEQALGLFCPVSPLLCIFVLSISCYLVRILGRIIRG